MPPSPLPKGTEMVHSAAYLGYNLGQYIIRSTSKVRYMLVTETTLKVNFVIKRRGGGGDGWSSARLRVPGLILTTGFIPGTL